MQVVVCFLYNNTKQCLYCQYEMSPVNTVPLAAIRSVELEQIDTQPVINRSAILVRRQEHVGIPFDSIVATHTLVVQISFEPRNLWCHIGEEVEISLMGLIHSVNHQRCRDRGILGHGLMSAYSDRSDQIETGRGITLVVSILEPWLQVSAV